MSLPILYSLTEQHAIEAWRQHPNVILDAFVDRARREAADRGTPPPPATAEVQAALYRFRTGQDPEDTPSLIPDAVNPDIVELRIEWSAGSPVA